MKPIPIMILSDSTDLQSGLARISRDICTVLSRMPEFRVASMGRGGRGSSKLPWPQYVTGENDWGESWLEECWRDFSDGEIGVLFPIFDPARLRYLVDARGQSQDLIKFMSQEPFPFRLWLYTPIDATGPGNQLSSYLADTIGRFDRILAYTLWGKDQIERATGRKDIDWLPHGINTKTFQPRGREGGRLTLGLRNNDVVVGTVMTNQTRKDWGTAAAAIAQLRHHIHNLRWWVHIDVPVRHWNIHALINDYKLGDITKLTLTRTMNDTDLSYLYSCCDLTILPSSEGYGYPIVESLACGVPVIHSTYAGGAELVPNPDWKIEPLSFRIEGPHNCLRPVFDPAHWTDVMREVLDNPWTSEQCVQSVEHLRWENLAGPWRKWLSAGIAQQQEKGASQ